MMSLLLRVLLTRFRDAQRQLTGIMGGSGEIDPTLNEVRNLAIYRINTEREMRLGLESQQFELHYQPIIALDGGYIAGFEALMRWRKEDGSYTSPVEFIPLAEDTGFIIELGRWALETGLRDHLQFTNRFKATWPDQPLPFMSINVSGLQLSEMTEIDKLASIIEQSGVDPSTIKLEITETLLVENPAHASEALKKIKQLGVLLAIDDFGTGYSSLSYLHQFPFDTLKIDRAFVINMGEAENSMRIVVSVAQLALSLEMDIVAEGIEELAQFETLREMGCHYGQGYYMAKPTTVEKIIELIESRPNW